MASLPGYLARRTRCSGRACRSCRTSRPTSPSGSRSRSARQYPRPTASTMPAWSWSLRVRSRNQSITQSKHASALRYLHSLSCSPQTCFLHRPRSARLHAQRSHHRQGRARAPVLQRPQPRDRGQDPPALLSPRKKEGGGGRRKKRQASRGAQCSSVVKLGAEPSRHGIALTALEDERTAQGCRGEIGK